MNKEERPTSSFTDFKVKKPWWKRPEIVVPSLACMIGGGFFSGFFGLMGHVVDMWEAPEKVAGMQQDITNIARRELKIENALGIKDDWGQIFTNKPTTIYVAIATTNITNLDP